MWDTLIIQPFTNVLLFIYNLVGQNFGIAIILFTLLIRLITHPLTVKQMRGTQGMTDLQKDPEWLEIQAKYKDDKEKLAQEQMRIYREKGVNPVGSCLPLLIQFPIIIGLYQAIIQSMANSPMDLSRLIGHVYPGFLNINELVPLNNHFLWMNLGQPERLTIPGLPFAIPVLAILVVVTTYVQSKLITPAAGGNEQAAQMTSVMNLYMPIFMGWLSWTLASGLALYFVVSNLFSIGQYALLGKSSWRNLIPKRFAAANSAEKNDSSARLVASPSVKPAKKESTGTGNPNRGKNESRKNSSRSNRTNR